MQDPTYPDGRSARVRLDGRVPRPNVPAPPATSGRRTGARALVAVVTLVLVAAAACSASSEQPGTAADLIGPGANSVTASSAAETTDLASPAVTLPEGFVLPDTRSVVLPPVLGRPQGEIDHSVPLLPVRGGSAVLRGTVFGPDGPLDGATVRLERFVGDDFGREDIATNGEGRWEAGGLLGGRYRVRAWARPDLATVEPQAAFVANENGSATLDLTVERHDGEQIQGALDAAEPHVGEVVTFRALISEVEVDDNGIVTGVGLEGREVQLNLLGGIRAVGTKKVETDAEGFATFSVVCLVTGFHGVNIRSGDLTADVDLPECLDGVLDNEKLPPEVPEFAVGATFRVPTAGPLPAGTYAATTAGTCGTSFQEFVTDAWINNVTLDRTFSVSNPIRNLTTVPGTTACSFRRTA